MKTLIETDRLFIRKITLDDCRELFELHSDFEVQKYTGEPAVESMNAVKDSIQKNTLKDYKKYGYGRWALILKDTSQFIGWAGLKYLPEFQKVDLGYRLKQVHWGKGYATEASKAIVEYGFNTLSLKEIIAIAVPEHNASIRVMEKVGMNYDKHAPYEEGEEDAIWYKIQKSAPNKF